MRLTNNPDIASDWRGRSLLLDERGGGGFRFTNHSASLSIHGSLALAWGILSFMPAFAAKWGRTKTQPFVPFTCRTLSCRAHRRRLRPEKTFPATFSLAGSVCWFRGSPDYRHFRLCVLGSPSCASGKPFFFFFRLSVCAVSFAWNYPVTRPTFTRRQPNAEALFQTCPLARVSYRLFPRGRWRGAVPSRTPWNRCLYRPLL